MKHFFTSLFVFSISFQISSQDIELEVPLENGLAETSGLTYINGSLISFNDSGAAAELYEIDITTGLISRTVQITNATNVDWEDISHDDTYIYIADFGNNEGSRTDLKVYRVSIADYTNTMDDTVTADSINFSYDDQTDFTPSPFSTNFDAEALLSYQNTLYIFTKNWIDSKTNIYQLSKTPGTYEVSKVDTIDTEGLVTGIAYNSLNNQIVLIGYSLTPQPFTMVLDNVIGEQFSESIYSRSDVYPPSPYSIQIEGITHYSDDNYFVSSEHSATGNQALFDMVINELLNTSSSNKTESIIYPNPSKSSVHILTTDFKSARIYSVVGELILRSKTAFIDISNLARGTYVVIIESYTTKQVETKKLIID